MKAAEASAFLDRLFEEAINKGNLDVVDELFAEDYLDHGPLGDTKGREEFKAMLAAWRAGVPDVHCEVDHVFAEGDRIAWVVHTTGTHTGDGLGFPATGRSFDTYSANVGIVKDGFAVEHWAEQGMFQMLVQLGLVPIP